MVFLQVTRWQGLVGCNLTLYVALSAYIMWLPVRNYKWKEVLIYLKEVVEWSEVKPSCGVWAFWWILVQCPLGRKRIKPWNDSINGTITWLLVKGMCFPGESPLNSAMPIRGLCDVPYTSCKKRIHGHNHTAIYQWSNFRLWNSLHHTSFTTKIDFWYMCRL